LADVCSRFTVGDCMFSDEGDFGVLRKRNKRNN